MESGSPIVVGNEPPIVQFVTPSFDDPFTFGQTVSDEIAITDAEPVDCSRVQVQYILGHDLHGHSLSTAQGCTGTFVTQLAPGHTDADNVAAVFVAEYEDTPTEPGVPALAGSAVVLLFPTPPAEPAAD